MKNRLFATTHIVPMGAIAASKAIRLLSRPFRRQVDRCRLWQRDRVLLRNKSESPCGVLVREHVISIIGWADQSSTTTMRKQHLSCIFNTAPPSKNTVAPQNYNTVRPLKEISRNTPYQLFETPIIEIKAPQSAHASATLLHDSGPSRAPHHSMSNYAPLAYHNCNPWLITTPSKRQGTSQPI